MKKNPHRILDIFYIVFGAFACAFGLVAFTIPNKIATGGLNGIATILFYSINFPVGATILIGNLFLVALQTKVIGKKSAWKTILSIIFTSLFIEVLMNLIKLPPLTTNPVLACLYGGILIGAGVGFTFRAGGTTGGIDIISQILNHKFHFPIGEINLILNCFVAIGAGFAFGPELALYGLLTLFFSSKVIDTVIEGIAVNRNVLIISQHSDEIGWAIIEDLHRGVTCLNGYGVYSARPTNILMTAIRRRELPILRRIVHSFDPNAFLIVGDARQVLGRGFKTLTDELKIEEDDK